ncbi:Putative sugar phosphate/phosphate translocator [Picochlorum sp. SENEW3]|nr:Putative sugar phosphate/phosphate translocator [Picochlorum sp. SENEW3]WPT14940.1 Putative sugar phosphate/phosphate translocator [Picochlorum sp. SENEW3]
MQWTLGHFGLSFPLILTSAHMGFSFLVLSPLSFGWNIHQHKQMLEQQWRGIFCIGAFMALNIALNNISLLYISLSLNQIIRSSIPVVTSLITVALEGRIPGRSEAFALIILTIGVMLAVWEGSLSGNPFAIMICMMGTISNALMMTTSGKLMSEKLDIIRLTFYTAPISLVCLSPFVMLMEAQQFKLYATNDFSEKFWILFIGCLNALSYNLVHALVIQKTSAVTSTVLGQIKIIGLLLAAAVILEERKEFSPRMLTGCFLTLIGFFLYSRVEIARLKAIPAKL